MSETLNTKNDVNKKLPSGYYIINNNEIVSGSDCFIRDCVGKSVTKVPPIIIHTRTGSKDTYFSNKDEKLNSTKVTKILNHYHKIIDKKEYSYDFSKFYYIEDEGVKGPSKVVLHNKDFPYNGYTYSNGHLSKKLSGNLTANDFDLDEIDSIEINNVTDPIYKTIAIKTNNDSGFLFDGTDVSDYEKIIKVNGVKGANSTSRCIKFYFHGFIINDSERFTYNKTSITVSANYYKPIKEIGTITKPENCQYGIYRLRRNGNLYDVNKYIDLKFDELAALPTNITNFYTREPTSNYNDPDTIATLLNNPEGGTQSDKMPNIIQSTETITEVYAIKHY